MFSLQADHGQFLTAEHGGGNEGEVRNGRPAGIAVADRERPGNVGDWQTFHLIPSDEPEYFGLSVETDQVEGARFACAEAAGALGIVVFNRPALGDWEKWKIWRRDDGKVAFESKVKPLHFIKSYPDGRVTLERAYSGRQPVDHPEAYESYVVHGDMGVGSGRPGVPGNDALALPVRADTRGWRDQSGYRPIILESFFPALYFEKHDPAHVDRVLDMFQADGINGVRVFGFVGGATGWGRHLGDGWRNREVLTMPMRRGGERLGEWHDARDVVVRFARKLHSRGMCWDLTAGDLQTVDGSEHEVYARICRWLEEEGLLDVLCLVEVNEGWQNSRRGNSPEHFRDLVAPFAHRGIPWGTSAHPPTSDDPGYGHRYIERMALPGSVACYHVATGHESQVRHTFNVRHDEEGIGFRRAVASTEHRGPGPDVSSGAVDAPGWVVLTGVCAVMTGQLFVLHVSQGIRDLPTDHGWEHYRPYAQRLTAMARYVPRARVTGLGHGGRGGHDPESIFASTQRDGMFDGDRGHIPGEFHRADSAAYDNGQVAALLYGGRGHRRIKADAVEGTFYDTHGNEYLSGRWNHGDIIELGDCGDGLLFVGRRV